MRRTLRARRAGQAAVNAAATGAGYALRAAPGLAGLGLVSYGAWLAWPPAGYLAAGALLLADVVAGRLPSRSPSGGEEL
ncbi:hypothetical protein [Streptomyces chryseus]